MRMPDSSEQMSRNARIDTNYDVFLTSYYTKATRDERYRTHGRT